MTSLEFLSAFRVLHDKARNGSLSPAERAKYVAAREHFTRFVVVAQQLGHAGKTLRSTLRMAKMLKVELRPDEGEPMKASTVDLASGGFAILTSAAMTLGKGAGFSLHLPRPGGAGTQPLAGRCTVVSSRANGSLFRVSFKFAPLAPDSEEQLAMALIDAVLERFNR